MIKLNFGIEITLLDCTLKRKGVPQSIFLVIKFVNISPPQFVFCLMNLMEGTIFLHPKLTNCFCSWLLSLSQTFFLNSWSQITTLSDEANALVAPLQRREKPEGKDRRLCGSNKIFAWTITSVSSLPLTTKLSFLFTFLIIGFFLVSVLAFSLSFLFFCLGIYFMIVEYALCVL